VLHVTAQVDVENPDVTPAGRLGVVKETYCEDPDKRLAVIVTFPVVPFSTERVAGEAATEKPNATGARGWKVNTLD
jgi:hypothetical protein